MKDIKAILETVELTDEQKQSIISEVNENYRTIDEVEKKASKIEELTTQNAALTEQVDTLNASVESLEGTSKELETLKAQVQEFNAAEERRKNEQAEAEKRTAFEQRFDAALGDRKFTNAFTRDAILNQAFEHCAANAGASAEDAIKALTDGKDGIWENPQNSVNNMPAATDDGDGTTGTPIKTLDDVKKLTPEQINENWETVSKLLSQKG